MDFGFNWKNSIGGLPRVFYSFGAGVLIYRVLKAFPYEKIFNSWLSLLILLIVVFLLGLPTVKYTEVYELMVVLILFPVLVLFATYVEPHKNTKLIAIYSTLGLTSYGVYILQLPFIYAYSTVFMKHGYHSILQGITAVFVLFFTALMIDKLYDKPVRKWMKSKFLGDRKIYTLLT